jgi:hypothetical protein
MFLIVTTPMRVFKFLCALAVFLAYAHDSWGWWL